MASGIVRNDFLDIRAPKPTRNTEVVGSAISCGFSSKDAIPSSYLYKYMLVIEHDTGDMFQWIPDNDSNPTVGSWNQVWYADGTDQYGYWEISDGTNTFEVSAKDILTVGSADGTITIAASEDTADPAINGLDLSVNAGNISHDDLSNLNTSGVHTIDAVSGLASALDDKASKSADINNMAGDMNFANEKGVGLKDIGDVVRVNMKLRPDSSFSLEAIDSHAALMFDTLGNVGIGGKGEVNKWRYDDGEGGSGYVNLGKLYADSEFTNLGGLSHQGEPVVLNSQGLIDPTMLDTSSFYPVAPWDPSDADGPNDDDSGCDPDVGCEYPDTSPEVPGAFWWIESFEIPTGTDPEPYYTFTTGDLAGRNITVGDFMVWASSGWGIMSGEMNPTLYYKLDGTYALKADFQVGGNGIVNVGLDQASTQQDRIVVYNESDDSFKYNLVSQLVEELDDTFVLKAGSTMTGTLRVNTTGKDVAVRVFEDTGFENTMWKDKLEIIDADATKYTLIADETLNSFRMQIDGVTSLRIVKDTAPITQFAPVTGEELTRKDYVDGQVAGVLPDGGTAGQVLTLVDPATKDVTWADVSDDGSSCAEDILHCSELFPAEVGDSVTEALDFLYKQIFPATLKDFTYDGYASTISATSSIGPLTFRWLNEGGATGLEISDSMGVMAPITGIDSVSEVVGVTTYSIADADPTTNQITWTLSSSNANSLTISTRWVYPAYYYFQSDNHTPTQGEVDSAVLNQADLQYTLEEFYFTPGNASGQFVVVLVPVTDGTRFNYWYLDGQNFGNIDEGEDADTLFTFRPYGTPIAIAGHDYEVYVQAYDSVISDECRFYTTN